VKKKLIAMLMVAVLLGGLLLVAFAGWESYWREIPPPEGEEVYLGQIDRYERDDLDREWAVISIDFSPYSVSCRANEEINSETMRPGTWVCFSLDGDYPYEVREAVFA